LATSPIDKEPVQICDTLRPLKERTLNTVRPPVSVHAVLVKKAALVIKAVSKLVTDDGA
jgi:hypothetical protein